MSAADYQREPFATWTRCRTWDLRLTNLAGWIAVGTVSLYGKRNVARLALEAAQAGQVAVGGPVWAGRVAACERIVAAYAVALGE